MADLKCLNPERQMSIYCSLLCLGKQLKDIIQVLLYLFGPSSRQKESVRVASSSKNSVAKASHHKLSLSCKRMKRI